MKRTLTVMKLQTPLLSDPFPNTKSFQATTSREGSQPLLELSVCRDVLYKTKTVTCVTVFIDNSVCNGIPLLKLLTGAS